MSKHLRLIIGISFLIVLACGTFLGIRVLSPPPAFALIDDTTLAVLSGTVEVQRVGGSLETITGNATLRVGDRIRTGANAYATVTYFEGSQTTLDPETDVTIKRLDKLAGGGASISFHQEIGRTWNRVQLLIGSESRFESTTAAAVAYVRGTSYLLTVTVSGETVVQSVEDTVIVESAGQTVSIPPGFQTTVETGQPPGPPVPAPPARFGFRLTVQGPVRPFLTDDRNRSEGFHPNVDAYGSQIPGATYLAAGDGQSITVPNPSGSYELVLTSSGAGGAFTVTVTSLANGEAVAQVRQPGLARPLAAEQLTGTIGTGGRLASGFSYRDGEILDFRRPAVAVAGAPERSRMLFVRGRSAPAERVQQTAIVQATAALDPMGNATRGAATAIAAAISSPGSLAGPGSALATTVAGTTPAPLQTSSANLTAVARAAAPASTAGSGTVVAAASTSGTPAPTPTAILPLIGGLPPGSPATASVAITGQPTATIAPPTNLPSTPVITTPTQETPPTPTAIQEATATSEIARPSVTLPRSATPTAAPSSETSPTIGPAATSETPEAARLTATPTEVPPQTTPAAPAPVLPPPPPPQPVIALAPVVPAAQAAPASAPVAAPAAAAPAGAAPGAPAAAGPAAGVGVGVHGGGVPATPPVLPSTGLQPFQQFTLNGDYVAAGVGLRGATGGTIAISGIPAGSTTLAAYLYWAMVDNGESPTLRNLVFSGTPLQGTKLGSGPDTCWERTDSHGYRADVTSLVGGNGSYQISGVATGGNILAEGASLIVIYENPASVRRTVVVYDGFAVLQVNPLAPPQVTTTLSGFRIAAPIAAKTTFVVGDGQASAGPGENFFDQITFTGGSATLTRDDALAGTDGPFWDTVTLDVSGQFAEGSIQGLATIIGHRDCVMWVGQALSVNAATNATPAPASPTPSVFAFPTQATPATASATATPTSTIPGALPTATQTPTAPVTPAATPSPSPTTTTSPTSTVTQTLGPTATRTPPPTRTPFTGPPPVSDNFSNAQDLPVPGSATGVNVNATVEAGEPEPTCASPGARERTAWFKIVAPQTTTITLTTENSDFDTILAVYTGTAFANLQEIACDDDIMVGVIQTLVSFNATAGQTYFVQLSGFAGNGAGTFFLQALLPPPNDNFAGAIAVPVGTSLTGSNRAATVESGEPSCSCVGRTVWYRFTPSQSEDVTITTHVGDTLDATLAVYTGASLSSLIELDSADSNSRGGPETITVPATAGQTYFVQLGGHSGTYGDYRLVISGPSAPAARAGVTLAPRPTAAAAGKSGVMVTPNVLSAVATTPTVTPTRTRTPSPTATRPPLASIVKSPPPTATPTPRL